MEPVFRPFCPRFGTLPTFVTLSLRTFKTSARCIRRPQTACFGSQTMCPFCGFTSRSKEFCLECGKPFPAGEKKRCNGAKVYRHSDSIRASDPVRDCWPYKENPFCPSAGARWRYTSGVIVPTSRGISGLETTTFSPACENEETHYEYRYFPVSGQ